MIPNLKLIAYGIAVAALLGAGLYIRNLHKQAGRVDGLVATINAQQAQLTSERQNAIKALELGHDLQKQLDATRVLNDRLSTRLRLALAVELSVPSSPPAGPPGTSGDGKLPSVFDSLNRVLASCQRDAIRLNGWREYYEAIPEALRAN
jgi:hypothetical protein